MDDEEGTVVYFQTSPALTGQEDQQSSEFSFTEAAETEEVRGEPPSSSAAPQHNGILRKLCSCGVVLIGSVVPDCSLREIEHRHGIAKTIMDSPLLTEEDYQLLYFALLKPHPQQFKSRYTLSPISASSKRCMVVISVALLAVCASLFSHAALMVVTVLGTVLLCLPSFIAQLIISRHERLCQSVRRAVSDYCRETEALLSLLSHSLHTVQEVEIVTRRYSRPFQRERGGSKEDDSVHYQCLGLRYTLFSACQTLLQRLKNAIISVHHQYPVSGELDDGVTGYLAFTSLDSLHPHITTNLESEDTNNHKCLSLESLKDAANLLAVFNSELLRHMALIMVAPTGGNGHDGGNSGTSSGQRVVPLTNIPGVLQPVREIVTEEKARLQWSSDFHKNRLFGDPPTRPSTAKTPSDRRSETASGLAREVHLMDTKTQAALQRIRDLGSQLTSARNSEVAAAIMKYREELIYIQRINDTVSDHIEDSLSIIHALQHPNTEKGGVVEEGSGVEDEGGEEAAEPVFTLPPDPQNEDSSTDDEKVFEAYVPALRETDEASVSVCSWRREDGEARREREMNTKMVRELEDVLAVRSEKRERRREERRQRRREQKEMTDAAQTSREASGTRTINSEPHYEREPFPSAMDQKMLATSTEQVAKNEESTSSEYLCEHHNYVPAMGGAASDIGDDATANENTRSLESSDADLCVSDIRLASQLAVRVAAIAASRRRTADTEIFGSSDDSSHSD